MVLKSIYVKVSEEEEKVNMVFSHAPPAPLLPLEISLGLPFNSDLLSLYTLNVIYLLCSGSHGTVERSCQTDYAD